MTQTRLDEAMVKRRKRKKKRSTPQIMLQSVVSCLFFSCPNLGSQPAPNLDATLMSQTSR